MATGWKAMKGDDAEWFLSQDLRTKKTVRRVWRRVLVDPTLRIGRGRVRRHLPLFQWSNPSVEDHLALFTHGVVGQPTLPKKTGRDYVEQITAEVREEREPKRRKDNVKSTLLRQVAPWLTPATGCLLVFIGLSQSELVAAEKLGIRQIQVRRTVPVTEHPSVITMNCEQCRDVLKQVPDFRAKGGQIPSMKKSIMIAIVAPISAAM